MVSHWSSSNSKSPQVFWTLLSILADLNHEVVWMVSTRTLISKFSNYNWYHRHFYLPQFFQFHSKVQVLVFLSIFSLWSARTANSTILQVLLFLLIITRSGRLAKFSMLICGIRLLCDWSFRLYNHIIYFCCFVATYQFFLWYDKSLWRCFELLLEQTQFLS